MAPAPNRFHQDISRNLEFILLKYLEQHPIGKLYDAPFDVYLTEHNVFQPDIVFVSKSRFRILTKEGAKGAPDLVVEVLSPKTARLDLDFKKKVYASTGVVELWIIDPKRKVIDFFLLQQDSQKPTARYRESDTFASALFPGLKICAAEIFEA